MNESLFKDLAQAFDVVSNHSYEFIVGKNNKKYYIISSINTDEFTHIVGFDHIPIIQRMTEHNTVLKKALYEQMLRGNFTYSNLKDVDITKLNAPLYGTYNSQSKQSYSLKDRIVKLTDINDIMDNAYNGKLYKWNSFRCNAQLPSGKKRNVRINADYVLKIPDKKIAGENIYIFLIQEYLKNPDKNKPIKLYVISAFPDCVDLTRGQGRPYTILEETKINKKTKESQILYTHPSYQKEKDELAAQQAASEISSPKAMRMTVNEEKNIPMNIDIQGGAAVLSPAAPRLPSFKELWNKFREVTASIVKALPKKVEKESIKSPDAAPKAEERYIHDIPLLLNSDKLKEYKHFRIPYENKPKQQSLSEIKQIAHQKYLEQQRNKGNSIEPDYTKKKDNYQR
ncbi:MAG: hypothetical protein ACI4XF_01305 [Oscillospiraceae bacterium]